jgi:hypothetical protein
VEEVGGIWGEARRGGVMWCGRGYVMLSERWDMGIGWVGGDGLWLICICVG